MNIVGNRLILLRESIHFSQRKITKMVGLTQSSINRYENGYAEAPYRFFCGMPIILKSQWINFLPYRSATGREL